MYKSTHLNTVSSLCRSVYFIFSLCWISGLLLGTLVAADFEASVSSLMRTAVFGRVSIISLCATAFFPFLLVGYIVYSKRLRILFLICFCKAFSFSFCAWLVRCSFGTAGWLMQPLLQFTDVCMVPVFCWFSIRYLLGHKSSLLKDGIVYVISGITVIVMDYFFITPFVAKLLDI